MMRSQSYSIADVSVTIAGVEVEGLAGLYDVVPARRPRPQVHVTDKGYAPAQPGSVEGHTLTLRPFLAKISNFRCARGADWRGAYYEFSCDMLVVSADTGLHESLPFSYSISQERVQEIGAGRAAQQALMSFLSHELCECLLLDGEHVQDPHPDGRNAQLEMSLADPAGVRHA